MAKRFARKSLGLTWVCAWVCAWALLLSAATTPGWGQEKKVDAAAKKLMAAHGLLARKLYPMAIKEYEEFLAKYAAHAEATKARYGLAISRFYNREYDKAVEALTLVVKQPKFEQRDEALAVLGHCYMSTGAHAKALAAVDELLKKYPSSQHAEVALLNRGQVLHVLGRNDESAAACREFLKKHPTSPRKTAASYSLALAQAALKRNAEAIKTLSSVVSVPNFPCALDATLLMGQCYEAEGKLSQAAGQYRKATESAPPDRRAEGYYSLGVVLYKAGKHDESVRALKSIAGQKSGRYASAARYQLGLAQLAAGKYADARKTLRAVQSGDAARAVRAKYWLARCDMAERKFDAALAALDALAKAKTPPPNLRDVLYDRAICTMALVRYDQAARQFTDYRKAHPRVKLTAKNRTDPAVLAANGRYTDVTYRLAFCLHKAEKYTESHALCLEVASLPAAPITPAAAELAAENLFLMGKYAEAADAFGELAKAGGDAGRRLHLAFRLSQCAYHQKQYDRAIELAAPLAANSKVLRDPTLRQAVFLVGNAQFEAGRFKDAAATLKRYLPVAGKDADETRFKLASAQLRSGQAREAEKNLQQLATGGKDASWKARAMFEYAQMTYKDGRPNKAAPVLARLLAAKPPKELIAPAVYLQGWIDFDAKRYAEAARRFGELADAHATHKLAGEARYQQGVSLLEAGQTDEALKVLQRYVRSGQAGKYAAQARRCVARCLAKLGRHAEAEKALSALVAAEKENVTEDLLYELAWSQHESKHPDTKKTYRRLLAAFPKGKLATNARAELAELLYGEKNYTEAAGLLEQVVADKSTDRRTFSVACYRLGWCYDHLGKPEKAAVVFSAFAAAGSDSELAPSAMHQAGMAYAKLSRLEEAEKQFAALVSRFPKHDLVVSSMLKLGEIQAQLESYDRSAATYTAFLKQFPTSKYAYQANFGIGWAMENQRKYDDARKWYAKVTASHNGPTAARAQFQAGECYFAEGKFDKAAGELLKVEIVYAYPEWSARALYEAGRAFEAMKQTDQAKSQYSACVKKYKGTASAAQAAKKLKELGGG